MKRFQNLYTRANRVHRVDTGDWNPVELGPGRYARWSPDGLRIAVWLDRRIYINKFPTTRCFASPGQADAKPPPSSCTPRGWKRLRRTAGETVTLVLERFEEHPQLESELLQSEYLEHLLPMFYAVEPPSHGR